MIFNRIIKLIIFVSVVLGMFFAIQTDCQAQEHKVPKVLVLSDSGQRNGTTYLTCGAAADIIAADIINELNKTGRVEAPLLGETMANITQKNIPLYYLTFFREYKNNYNIDFVNLKRVTHSMDADYILLITSGMDIQSRFLKTTWWNKLGIAEGDPVIPTYRLSTLVSLIDKKTYSVIWQDMYLRDLKAHDYDIGFAQFSPGYAQLSKIKKYSANMSEYVAKKVDEKVNPWIVPQEEPKAIEMKSRFINEGTKLYYPTVNGEVVKQNLNDVKQNINEAQENYKSKREQRRIEKEQQKYIENVRMLEQKRQQAELKRIEENSAIDQKPVKVKKQEPRLFDSIREDIYDSQPPQLRGEKYIPAVEVQPAENIQSTPELITPVMEKPAAAIQTKPAVNKTVKPQTLKPETNNLEPAERKNKVPQYDWNIKNINLKKIGHLI